MQTLILGTEIPILGAVDCGSSGALVKNDENSNLTHIKTPSDGSGTDLLAVRDFLQGCEMVIMEHPPLGGFGGHTSLSENGCFQQFKEMYGLLTGAGIPFHCVRPQAWQKFFNFPKKGKTPDKEWKSFLHQQAMQRFPTVAGMPKYSADAYLLYRMATLLWPLDRNEWP